MSTRKSFLKQVGVVAGAAIFLRELPTGGYQLETAEGAALPKRGSVTIMQGWVEGDRLSNRLEMGFEQAMSLPWGKENIDFPVLKRAVADMGPAYSTEVEWIYKNRLGRRIAKKNYTQIIRTPYTITGTMVAAKPEVIQQIRRQALKHHLKSVEEILRVGVPFKSVPPKPWHLMTEEDWMTYRPMQTMGGARHFLGRMPQKGDTFSLRVLRDLALYLNRQHNDSDSITDEWLSEISLVAHR